MFALIIYYQITGLCYDCISISRVYAFVQTSSTLKWSKIVFCMSINFFKSKWKVLPKQALFSYIFVFMLRTFLAPLRLFFESNTKNLLKPSRHYSSGFTWEIDSKTILWCYYINAFMLCKFLIWSYLHIRDAISL